MDPFAAYLRDVLELAGAIYFRRVETELWKFAEALDQWLHELFAHPRPDWRESLDRLLAEQESEGRVIEPQSRQELLDFLEGWAATVDWNAVERGVRRDNRPPSAVQVPRPDGRFAPRTNRNVRAAQAFFFQKLREAKNELDEMERVLEAFGRKLDAARPDVVVDVEEVDAIERMIWRHNDAMEIARAAWLDHNLGSRAFDELILMSPPSAVGLPLFTDEKQAERARAQWKQITKRLDQRIAWLDRIIFTMQVAEAAGTAASLALGAGVVLTAVKQGGKWAVVKTVAKVAASGAAAYAAGEVIEQGLRAAGADEETIHGVRLAAEVVTWLLLLRRVSGVAARQPPSSPRGHVSPRQPTVSTIYPRGSFSIHNWSGYPQGLPKPRGPFRVLRGSEYDAARKAAHEANRAIRQADPASYVGKEIHEIHPVKFGGSPTDPSNKVALPREFHRKQVTPWWNRLLRILEGEGG